ncbi:MAG: Gfo/Idh/MocA family oxidoreductase [Omnitrophica bacterium]|nr:Gfo/Idh/MocA family oxidoreductase [Candidatus Omnitrophota bacterium]
MKPLNIVIIGAGMYVSGRGTDGYGTVMPAIGEWKRNNISGDIQIVGTSRESVGIARNKIDELKRNMRVEIAIRYFPEDEDYNPRCFREVISKISKPAACIVCVPDNLHGEIAYFAAENGLHTLVVKPLAPTLEEVRALIEVQEKNKVYCAVEFHKRFDHANLKLRDTILGGVIGDPLYFLVEYSQRKNVPSERFKKWVETTNVFQYLGIHYVDIIYFATKAVPKRAMATGQKGWLASKGTDIYDSVQGVIEWEMSSGKKFSSHILTNWIDPENTSAMSDQKIKVIGTKGRFESDQKKRGITIITDEKGIEEPNPYFCSAYGQKGDISYRGYGIESICRFLDDVVQIEKGTVRVEDMEGKRPTFKESFVSTAVLEAINTSLENAGTWITIDKYKL